MQKLRLRNSVFLIWISIRIRNHATMNAEVLLKVEACFNTFRNWKFLWHKMQFISFLLKDYFKSTSAISLIIHFFSSFSSRFNYGFFTQILAMETERIKFLLIIISQQEKLRILNKFLIGLSFRKRKRDWKLLINERFEWREDLICTKTD